MRTVQRRIVGWLTRGVEGKPHAAPIEAAVLRSIGSAWLIAVFVVTFTTHPHPGLHGRGLIVLLGFALLLGSSLASQPRWTGPPGTMAITGSEHRTVLALLGVTAGAAVLALVQPNGIWLAGPYFVAIIAATRLSRRSGALMLVVGIAPFTIGALIKGDLGTALSASVGVAPWYLILRLMRLLGERNRALDVSRAAEADAAVIAERSRIARELHDVLAHSLSALALQLESTRLLARDRDVDPEIARAIDQAHSLAASGLDDARRAIAAARGDELPGPERLEALAGAFGDQSGVPVAVEVHGEPRELAPDARLAVYRTAQEALTNVRRHAAAERVRVCLDFLADHTVLVVEDHSAAGTPPPVQPDITDSAGGYGLTGMRERAKLLGGELVASPTVDGFRVELRLPA
ncbi:MAG TPA: histidine kinase [Solirubrobacteraceae bacterium]|jgi:signal transduction histidine kinase|nr:histidine kinase [Solirubrobacteraceae bacterium]